MNLESTSPSTPSERPDRAFIEARCAPNANGCWMWQRLVDRDGYGRFEYHGTKLRAHRVMFEAVHNVKLVLSQFVCHRCDTPGCCNPDHLFVGTHLDNMADMYGKKRSFKQRITVCPRGHLFSEEGRAWSRDSNRRCCRACSTIRKRLRLGWTKERAENTPTPPRKLRPHLAAT